VRWVWSRLWSSRVVTPRKRHQTGVFAVGAALARNGRIVALYFIPGRENLDRLEVEIV
jgi:hypothetical protein